MSSKWPRVSLGEVASVITGFPFKGNEYLPEGAGIRVVRGDNVTEHSLRWAEKEKCWHSVTEELKPYLLQLGDVVIGMDGSKVGKNFASVTAADGECLLAQRVARVRSKQALDQTFLRYLICNPLFTDYVQGVHTGTSIPHISKSQIEQFEVFCPPLTEQIAAGFLLQSLDDRIALLRETNRTLEEMARLLFRAWFVDFEPVRAKMAGLPPKSCDAATAEPFPSRLVDSELGDMPEGWEINSLYDLADYINGAAYRAFWPNLNKKGLPIIKIAELKNGITEQTGFSDVTMPEKYKINDRDILFSWSGNPDTSIDTFIWFRGLAWLNQHIWRVAPYKSQERSFVFCSLKHMNPIFAEIARNKQTTGLGHVTVSDLKRLRIVRPNESIIASFNKIVDPLLEQIFACEQKSMLLSGLRDELLPRLMSGSLKLPESLTE